MRQKKVQALVKSYKEKDKSASARRFAAEKREYEKAQVDFWDFWAAANKEAEREGEKK